jgi:hypothetical protein
MNMKEMAEWELTWETEVLEVNLPEYQCFSNRIRHDLTWDRIQIADLGSWQVTGR